MKFIFRNKNFLSIIFIVSLIPGFISLSCQGSLPSEVPPAVTPEVHSWTVYTPFKWTHDGHPFGGSFITIYSDGAGDALKQQVCDLAERQFVEIMETFEFDRIQDFLYPPGYNCIDIYVNRFQPDNIAWAYWGGFLITIRVEPLDARWLRYLTYTAKHELVHVFEFLIEGKPDIAPDVWFKEGLAVHLADPEAAGFNLIDSVTELDAWKSRNQDHPDHGNPIAIHYHTDYPPDADRTYYYIVFEFVMRYLLDNRGGGRSLQEVLDLFYDMRNSVPFARSFEHHFGIPLDTFEQEFYDRARAYLLSVDLTHNSIN